MKTTRVNLKDTTVGELKKALESIPDDIEIDVTDVGRTGFTRDVILEICEYSEIKVTTVSIDIEAESGYY